MRRKPLTDSLEQPSTVSSSAPQEGGQVYPLRQTHSDAHAEHLAKPFSRSYFFFLNSCHQEQQRHLSALNFQGWSGPAAGKTGKYIGIRWERCAQGTHLMPQPPNVFSPLCSGREEKHWTNQRLYATTSGGTQLLGEKHFRTFEISLSVKHNGAFSRNIEQFLCLHGLVVSARINFLKLYLFRFVFF